MQQANGEPWQDIVEYTEDAHFVVSQVTSRRKAHLELADLVKKIRKESGQSLMVVVQSQQHRMLLNDIPILNEFAVLTLKTEEADRQLPPLGWQSFVAKRLVGRWLDLGSWLTHLTELARYGGVPICNLEKHDPSFLIDIAFARRLQKENVVLWWSQGPRPDHAGYEKDDVLTPLEADEMPSVNVPGTYSTVCIDVEVKNLLINTILTSSLINDAEGSDSVSFNPTESADGTDTGFLLHGENTFSSAGIKILRDMVKAWHTEACSGSTMADVMVQHLIRWIESPNSCL